METIKKNINTINESIENIERAMQNINEALSEIRNRKIEENQDIDWDILDKFYDSDYDISKAIDILKSSAITLMIATNKPF